MAKAAVEAPVSIGEKTKVLNIFTKETGYVCENIV